MCFGKAWSASSLGVLALTSLAGWYQGLSYRITAGTAFLAIKELIQLLLYYNIGGCTNTNKLLTVAAWIHISFQPLFMNLFISAFSNSSQLYDVPIMMCLIYAIANVFRLKEIRGNVEKECVPDVPRNLCRPWTCSKNGKYHLAYGFELNSSDVSGYTPSMFAFFLLMFAPAFIIGDWILGLVNVLVATLAFTIIAHDTGEAAAVWCVNSAWIAFFAIYYMIRGGNPLK